ncbi:hypothetical protein GN244_ATG13785 [Phytophthora infestans]|uniref:Secreted RxLR effector peptide protein n=1 Tax=Phytophthora infestans TaxID=4787 RepID=A0A833VYM1_PHYIN|nr:hypothetical protein GN244_ATG13785 [Phytophthora infestans]
MRLLCILVVVASTFPASTDASVDLKKVGQRALRIHHTSVADSEERGLTPEKLKEIGKKVGVDPIRAMKDSKYFNNLGEKNTQKFVDAFNAARKAGTKVKKAARITIE